MAQLALRAAHTDSFDALSRRLATAARTCTLFRQAALNDEAYARLGELLQETLSPQSLIIVLEGELTVTLGDFTQTLEEGDSFGAKYLLEAQPQQEFISGHAKVLVLDGPAYDQFAKEFPESAFALQGVLARQVLQELKKAQTNLRLLFETLKSVG